MAAGTTLNFGVMIGKLKRDKLMRDVMEDDTRKRYKWVCIARSDSALKEEVAAMARAHEVRHRVEQYGSMIPLSSTFWQYMLQMLIAAGAGLWCCWGCAPLVWFVGLSAIGMLRAGALLISVLP